MADLNCHASVKYQDALGVVAAVPYYLGVDDTQVVSDIATFVNTLITELDHASDAQLIGVDLVIGLDLPGGVKTSPATGSEVERTGLFNFLQAGIKYKFGVIVPSLKASLIVNGKINLADAIVTALVGTLTGSVGVLQWQSTAANVLEALSDALISFRKHRRAENRRSFEV